MNIFRFVKGAMNIVDLLGILPYFMSLVLQLVTTEDSLVRASLISSDRFKYPQSFTWSSFIVVEIFCHYIKWCDWYDICKKEVHAIYLYRT